MSQHNPSDFDRTADGDILTSVSELSSALDVAEQRVKDAVRSTKGAVLADFGGGNSEVTIPEGSLSEVVSNLNAQIDSGDKFKLSH